MNPQQIDTGVPGYSWKDPNYDHTGMAFDFANKGDNERAVAALRSAVRFSRNPKGLMNLGVVLSNAGQNLQSLAALHEARLEAIRYGDYYRHGFTAPEWELEWNQGSAGAAGGTIPGESLWWGRKDKQHLRKHLDFAAPLWRGSLKPLLKFKCNDKSLRVDPGSIKDRHNYELQLDKAAKSLAACGVVILTNSVRKEHVRDMYDSSQDQFRMYLRAELKTGQDPRGDCPDCERHNISVRSEGRHELKVPLKPPWSSEETYNNVAVRGVRPTRADQPTT